MTIFHFILPILVNELPIIVYKIQVFNEGSYIVYCIYKLNHRKIVSIWDGSLTVYYDDIISWVDDVIAWLGDDTENGEVTFGDPARTWDGLKIGRIPTSFEALLDGAPKGLSVRLLFVETVTLPTMRPSSLTPGIDTCEDGDFDRDPTLTWSPSVMTTPGEASMLSIKDGGKGSA